VYAQK
jgi:hypothetical protein